MSVNRYDNSGSMSAELKATDIEFKVRDAALESKDIYRTGNNKSITGGTKIAHR